MAGRPCLAREDRRVGGVTTPDLLALGPRLPAPQPAVGDDRLLFPHPGCSPWSVAPALGEWRQEPGPTQERSVK